MECHFKPFSLTWTLLAQEIGYFDVSILNCKATEEYFFLLLSIIQRSKLYLR